MDKSEWRIRPGFLLGLFVIFVFFAFFVPVFFGVPTEKDKAKAKKIQTMSEERIISSSLEESANSVGGLTNLNRQFILDSVFADNQYRMWLHTNGTGELIDIWQTPYRIELVGPTNFVIHSAGRNQKFGDADDIVFNSASNDFVKP
jgi:hypothetical protein